jgi:methionine-rich copper-binding protein CopC
MVVKITNKTFKAKVLKKNKSFKAVTVTKNQGAVTYKATLDKKSKKALKFAKGKITVKKKTKKGTYKVKVRITAKGNANYLSGYVNKVIKVKVK